MHSEKQLSMEEGTHKAYVAAYTQQGKAKKGTHSALEASNSGAHHAFSCPYLLQMCHILYASHFHAFENMSK